LVLQPLRFLFRFLGECCVVVLIRITKKSTDYYLKNIDKLPKEDYISITYEDFCVHPLETVQKIMETLSLTMVQNIDAAALMKPRNVELDSAVRKLQMSIKKSMKGYFDLFHYTTDV